ncbi:MAG TPA: tail fiber domain-containing protein [Bacteroidota bacterium]|nr:tail fiber domain-containing protein [Bacteroidota bacterium]
MKWFLLVLATLMLSMLSVGQVPQLVSHQGYIADSNGVGVTDSLAMTFRLYTDSTAGSLALTQSFPAIGVIKGIFNVNLDVSSMTFSGQYWLESEVEGEILLPRTRLTSAPYALAPWVQSGSDVYYDGGNVGVGTTSPSYPLHVQESVPNVFVASIENQNATGWGLEVRTQDVSSTRNALEIYTGGTSRFLVRNDGKVGIGTTSPSSLNKLHVAGGDLGFDDNNNYGINWVSGSDYRARIFRWVVDNRVYVSNNGLFDLTGVYLVSGGTSWISTSDKRLKENIVETGYGLSTVMRIPVREYNLKGRSEKKIGFVAQDLYPIVPEIVSKGDDGEFTSTSSPWGIDYAGLTPILVKSIQEQQQQIESLLEKLTKLEARLRQLESGKSNQE